jgi:glycosyltransferase involved in cell wall biosynthesis
MMTGALLGRAVRLGASYRLVTTVHNEWQRSAIIMGVGDRVIAVSDAVARHMNRRGIPNGKLRVVRNGPLGSPRRSRVAAPSSPIRLRHPAIVTVAGLSRRKGISELITAFEAISNRFPDACLYVVGDGPDGQIFKAEATATTCRDRIYFIGFVPDPRPYLSDADIFVLASHKDPFPLVIAEAREAGSAIIASQVDGIPEALEGGRAGILVPPGDAIALSMALAKLLQDPEERAVWQRRSAANLEWLQLSRASDETVAIYREALEQATSATRQSPETRNTESAP